MRYLPINVYTNQEFGDCTNGGITAQTPARLVVPCGAGHITEEDVAEHGYTVLGHKYVGSGQDKLVFEPAGETRWTMFGGNFVWSSDSRFRKAYGDAPVAVHDRIEG